jgi:5-deoxy-D-glucuronate isomerase
MLFGYVITVYSENHTEHMYEICRQSSELLNVNIGEIKGSNGDEYEEDLSSRKLCLVVLQNLTDVSEVFTDASQKTVIFLT